MQRAVSDLTALIFVHGQDSVGGVTNSVNIQVKVDPLLSVL